MERIKAGSTEFSRIYQMAQATIAQLKIAGQNQNEIINYLSQNFNELNQREIKDLVKAAFPTFEPKKRE